VCPEQGEGVSRETVEALARGEPAPGWSGLSARERDQFAALLSLLASDAHAPTTATVPAEAWRVHVADSLAALELGGIARAREIADLGSGAGFPGLALAIALPRAAVALIESQKRKCEFIERACAAAEIANARVVCVRAEEWREGAGRHEVVLARALAPQAVVVEYAAPLLRIGGRLVDWRGRREAEAERAAVRAAEIVGLRAVEVRRVTPFAAANDRHLHVFEKREETPARFPRRAGVARKRPLGG
jgi:16S rRNA (guanine527-N7)-methyltransferase